MAWFLIPFRTRPGPLGTQARFLLNDLDFGTDDAWHGVECLGNHAVVKVSDSVTSTILAAIVAIPGAIRIPADRLGDSLSCLTSQQELVILDKLCALGYTSQEIQQRFGGDIGRSTLGDLLRFILTRRVKGRFDRELGVWVFDGPEIACQTVDWLDGQIQ